MDTILAALADQHDELAGLLAPLETRAWNLPTPCEGWGIADVVLHLAQTDELAVASVRGEFAEGVGELTRGLGPAESVDAGAAAMVARDRGEPGPAVAARWSTGAATLREAFRSCDPHRRLVWVAGELSARTLATTRLAETWIHTGDVARALGQDREAPDRLRHIARLAWRTLPYAFARDGRALSGPVAFSLRGPHGDLWDFVPDSPPTTVITGAAFDLCAVAARRVDPRDTSLRGEGPDSDAVLELVRTYA